VGKSKVGFHLGDGENDTLLFLFSGLFAWLVRIMKATCEVGALSTLFNAAVLTFGIEFTLGTLFTRL